MEPVSERCAHEGQRDAGGAGGVLDDGVPGCSRPSPAAASMAAWAIRSFMLPVGLAHSSLAMTRADPGGTTRTNSTSGVFPMPASAPPRAVSMIHLRIVWRPTTLPSSVPGGRAERSGRPVGSEILPPEIFVVVWSALRAGRANVGRECRVDTLGVQGKWADRVGAFGVVSVWLIATPASLADPCTSELPSRA